MNAAAHHIEELQKKGYTLIKNGLDPQMVQTLLAKIKVLFDNTPRPDQTLTPYLNRGHQVVYNLQSKDVYFITAKLRHPMVMQILTTLLNDEWYKQIPQENPNFILRAMGARSGGAVPLPLHIDSFIPSSGKYCWAAQVSYILEDQTEENGCTVVVPGSHLSDSYADQSSLKDAVPVISKAGDILIWDSRLWHGTRGNNSTGTRWIFISTYCRWWLKQNYAITETLPPEFYAQLTDPERAVMGYCSLTPRDENERIDIKGGYDILPKERA